MVLEDTLLPPPLRYGRLLRTLLSWESGSFFPIFFTSFFEDLGASSFDHPFL
jgi:hypothetical protein